MTESGRWLTALITLTAGSSAFADSPARPHSYKRITPGGEYVFVMVAAKPVEADTQGWNEETAAGIREIRRTYARSGLYRNDGSAEPLWTVDWYAHGVTVASDGVHLIRYGPWAVLSRPREEPPSGAALEQEALSFFGNGELLRTYSIGELVDDPGRLSRSVAHFDWMAEGRFDDPLSEYTLTTLDGNRFVFDVRTGGIVSEFRGRRFPLWVLLALGAALCGICWVVWRRGSPSRGGAAPGRPRG